MGGRTRPSLDDGSDWPTFGADHANTGHAPDASGPTADARVAWQFDAGSPAPTASPVVVGDAVFTGGSGPDGSLYALDAESGDRHWAFDTRGGVTHAPAFADGVIFVGTDDRRFHAVDARTGEERWTTALGRDLRDSSPTVADNTVYVGTVSGAPTGGSPIDNSSTGDSPTGGSPTTASDGSGGGSEATDTRESRALVALDAETGGECWSFATTDAVSTTPAVVGDRVYFGDDAGHVHALDAATGEQVWSFAAGARVASSPAVTDGVCYFGARGLLFALDAESGEPNWTFDLQWPTVTCSPAVADGTVYVGCHADGGCPSTRDACDPPDRSARLCAVDADYGARKWTYDLTGGVRSSPAVADGVVYLGGADGVSAVDAGDGTEAWRVEFGESVDSSPAVADGRVFVSCADGSVYALGE